MYLVVLVMIQGAVPDHWRESLCAPAPSQQQPSSSFSSSSWRSSGQLAGQGCTALLGCHSEQSKIVKIKRRESGYNGSLFYTSPQSFYDNGSLFVGLTTLETFTKF